MKRLYKAPKVIKSLMLSLLFFCVIVLSACHGYAGGESEGWRDGKYAGKGQDFDDAQIVLEVTVKDGAIMAVEIIASKGDSYVEAARGVVRRVIEAQSLDVDTVTGATISSGAVLEAIRNALEEAPRAERGA